MREMAAMREVEPQDGVARREHRGEGRRIGLRTGVRLHVDVLGLEKLLGAIARQIFDDVGVFAAAVVAPARDSLRRTYW